MDGFETIPLKDTEGAYCPFFSPDGQWIAFFTDNKLKKVSVIDNTVLPLLDDAPLSIGGSWGINGDIVISQSWGNKLTWLSETGKLKKHFNIITKWPQFLPDGKTLITSSRNPQGIKLVSLETGIEKILIQGSYAYPRYVKTGHLLFEKDGIMQAMGFDLKKQKITSNPVPVLNDVRVERQLRALQCAFSNDGLLVYLEGSFQGIGQLTFVNRQGDEEILPFSPKEYIELQLSPNGQSLAVTVRETSGRHLYKYDLIRTVEEKVAADGKISAPVWDPNGQWITFASEINGNYNIFMKRIKGGEEKKPLIQNNPYNIIPTSWSSDGKILAMYEFDGSGDIFFYDIEQPDSLKPVIYNSEAMESWPVFSPDNRWIGYISDEEGDFNTYIASYPGPGDKKRISPDRGSEPIWSKTSQEILYFTWGDKTNTLKWMVIPYSTEPTLN
jgi:serine/threonine-protein kinase